MLERSTVEYCGTNGSVKYAGVHLIMEMWGARGADDESRIEEVLRQAVSDCGATMLSLDLHTFSPTGGVSGVGILKESHITIHTWPEYDYAALDLFLCGTLDPYKAVPALQNGFQPDKLQLVEMKRGILQ